jgi:hypothetical protein
LRRQQQQTRQQQNQLQLVTQQQKQRQLQAQLMAPLASLWWRKVLLLMVDQAGRPFSTQCMLTMRPRLHMAAAGYGPTPAHQPSSSSSSTSPAAGVLLQQLLTAQLLPLQQPQARTAAG